MATFGEKIHGRAPQVAPFIPTDPIEMLKKLLSGEISDWPQITQISDLYQQYMQSALEKEIPGFSEMLKLGSADTQAILGQAAPLLKGEIPEDVKNQVLRSSAFQSLGAGTAGSPMAGANAARSLGLTSLDLISKGAGLAEQGGNAAQRWQQMAMGTILPPTSQMYSPEWFTNFMAQQNAARQATKQFRYNVEAAPDPAWADRAKLFAQIVGMAAGGGMGGGGLNPTGSYSQIYGAANASGSGGPGMGLGGGYTPTGASNPVLSNPGFFTNFQSGYNATPGGASGTQMSPGVGGMIGNWFGSLFNQSATPSGGRF